MGHGAKKGPVLQRFSNDFKQFLSDFKQILVIFKAISSDFKQVLAIFKRFHSNVAAALGNQARPYVVSYGLTAEILM